MLSHGPLERKSVPFGAVLCVLAALAMTAVFTFSASAQKASSLVIHDATGAGNGGENATSGLRNELKSALERERPCVETMDDQDIRDAIQDERERALLEGGDSDATLKAIGDRMGAGVVVMVKATPGPNGTTVYTASAMDPKTGRILDRQIGTGDEGAKQAAENLVRNLGPYLSNNCRPHWIGTITYEMSSNETKQKTDAGEMRAASRNTKRTLTETSQMSETIKATLLPPKDNSVSSPQARVMHRTKFVYNKDASTTGELYCRLPGRNPFWKGFSQEYTETTTQLGQGTDTMPVFISIDDNGSYSIKVTAPGGVLYGKFETSRSASGCGDEKPVPDNNAISMPEGKIQATSFDANGQASSPKPTSLAGSQSLGDGKIKISWNLRLVKPK